VSLEMYLGRSLSASDAGTVPSLNELPPELLAEARALAGRSRLAAVELLRFYVVRSDLDHTAAFVDEVLLAQQDAAGWGFQDMICVPQAKFPVVLTRSVPELLNQVKSIEGERWLRIEPALAAWDWSPLAGGPGVVVRAAPYWWVGPDDSNWAALDREPAERIVDLSVGVRRWIASRVAWELRMAKDVHTIEEACVALRISRSTMSRDSAVAIDGWLRERSIPSSVRAPGFRGPDSWYRGSED
jgi:hypothetical protein